MIGVRKQLRELVSAAAGKAIHPVFGLPGGVSRALTPDLQDQAAAAAAARRRVWAVRSWSLPDDCARQPGVRRR